MATIRCTLKELKQGVAVPLDERTKLVVVPDAALVTMLGRAFDPRKSFPLPRAVSALRDVFGFALRLQGAQAALVVGHVSADGDAAAELSAERAKILMAWLEGDPQPWLDSYGDGIDEERRWGAREDRLMLGQFTNVAEGGQAGTSQNGGGPRDELVAQYQQARRLSVDGIAGPITRGELIKDYFALTRNSELTDQTSAEQAEQDSSEPKIAESFGSHGAAAAFSLADAEKARKSQTEASEEAPATSQKGSAGADAPAPKAETETETEDGPSADAAPSAEDERIDFFFFFSQTGVDPAPGAVSGPEYLEWIAKASLSQVVRAGHGDQTTGSELSLVLLDKTGTVRHANRQYTLRGPEDFAGTTNSLGELHHSDVMEGDYTLELTLEFFEGDDQIVDKYTSPVIVLKGGGPPQVRLLGAVPRCKMARLRGMLFDTNKAFLLPSAIADLKQVRKIYEQNNPSKLLVVGHTDTTGDASINDSLSLERAQATLAYLEDDVDTWLKFYDSSVRESRRWGEPEDNHMLTAVLGDSTVVTSSDMQRFKEQNDVDEEGVGTQTRRALITRYMALDGEELDSGEFDIEAKAHGCGENFPVDDTGQELDTAPEDDKEDALDRRVELFFFDTEFGIAPAPVGDNSPPGSTQYPTWRKLAKQAFDSVIVAPPGMRPCRVLLIRDGEPQANTAFALEFDGRTATGVTTADGFVQVFLPESTTTAVLRIVEDDTEIELVFGNLAPETEALGAQQRLNNLGFSCGREDGELADVATAALRLFQKCAELSESGKLDTSTSTSLKAQHGS